MSKDQKSLNEQFAVAAEKLNKGAFILATASLLGFGAGHLIYGHALPQTLGGQVVMATMLSAIAASLVSHGFMAAYCLAPQKPKHEPKP